MIADRPAPFFLLTPNLLGADGISALSRLLVRALHPTAIVSLNETAVLSGSAPTTNVLRGSRFIAAQGSRPRLLAATSRLFATTTRDSTVVCVHLHLAPAAVPLTWRGAKLATILCGIEAWKPLTTLQTMALKRSTTLVAISKHTAMRFKEANPAFAEREIPVCYPGLPVVVESQEPVVDAASNLPAPGYALITSRMAPEERYKGHDLLLEIWPAVRRIVPAARLVVAGDGADRGRLEEKAARIGVSEAVRFVGRVSDETLARLYRDCALFVMPSLHEGFGLAFLEAMRAGKPCLGAPGAAAEIIRDGQTGFLVDPADRECVVERLVRLFRDDELRERLGQAGAARFGQCFTEAHFQERLALVFGA